ncbi:uncharacterized [Tachysurus ichikawai]
MLCTATLRSDSPDSNGHRSELLEESEHQVPEGGPQWLVVVTHDVRCVLFQLDECVLGLQMQDVTVRRLLHLHLRDSILTTNKNKAQPLYPTRQAVIPLPPGRYTLPARPLYPNRQAVIPHTPRCYNPPTRPLYPNRQAVIPQPPGRYTSTARQLYPTRQGVVTHPPGR